MLFILPLPELAGAARFGATAFALPAPAFGGRPRPFLAPFSSFFAGGDAAAGATGSLAGFSAFFGDLAGGASTTAALRKKKKSEKMLKSNGAKTISLLFSL